MLRFSGPPATQPSELVGGWMQEHWGELGREFHAALCRAGREVPPDELWRRLSAVIALVASMLAQTPELGLLDPDDPDGTPRRVVEFLAPGVRAPSARGA